MALDPKLRAHYERRLAAVEDFNRRMRVYQTLPWWRRLITPVPDFKRAK